MNNLMKTYVSLNRLAFINYFTIVVAALAGGMSTGILVSTIFAFFLTFHVVAIVLAMSPAASRAHQKRSAFGRGRILIVMMSAGSLVLGSSYIESTALLPVLLFLLALWSTLLLCLRKFCNEVTSVLDSLLGRHHYIGIIGTNKISLQMADHLRHKKKSSLIRYINNYEDALQQKTVPDEVSAYSLIDFAKEKGEKELYITAPVQQAAQVRKCIQEADKLCIRVSIIVPKAQPKTSSSHHIRYINGTPVWKRYNEPLLRTFNRIAKRVFDLFVSGLVILFLLSWLIPLLAVVIRLDSKGPVFFRQLRSGRDNRPFDCLKFRSMRANNECDSKQASSCDSRITKVGAFLRKTSLDEFPQFINVWKGDMSLVGPRPHMLRHTEEYSKLIRHYMGRLYLKPGITGLAQVNGYRGETLNLRLMAMRVKYDIKYMENWSLWLDIKIMILTLRNIIAGDENAF